MCAPPWRFVRCHAAEFGIDPNRLVLLGEDSGANLAARLATERPEGVVGAVLIGGLYDRGAVASPDERSIALSLTTASPVAPASRSNPPVLVVHGEADTEVPSEQARRYCAEVTASGSRCQFVGVAGASHRSENWFPSQWSYKREIVTWLGTLTHAHAAGYRPRTGAVLKDIPYSPSRSLRLDAAIPQVREAGTCRHRRARWRLGGG